MITPANYATPQQAERSRITTAFFHPVNTRLAQRLNRGASVSASLILEQIRVNRAEQRLAESRRETLRPF